MLIHSSNTISSAIFNKTNLVASLSVIAGTLTMTYISWILSHKLLCFVIATATAFGIATIALGVENVNLKDKINDLEKENNSNPTIMTTYKLPTNVKPLLYNLYLYPNLTTGLFNGKLYIYILIFHIYFRHNGLNIVC